MDELEGAHYSPPWANTSIIGVAGSSGSGKTSLAMKIVNSLNLPWVVVLSMDSFYKVLNEEENRLAHCNEFDFDSPNAIDFDLLLDRLRDLKAGRRAEIPRYSFEAHNRETSSTSIYSPHVLILEGIFALYDPRILELLDIRIFCEADADVCLARRILRDVRERARDVDGCVKQWLRYVKPNFERYVEPQRKVADILVPRGIENLVAIDMVVNRIQSTLREKSRKHQESLSHLAQALRVAADDPQTPKVQDITSVSILRHGCAARQTAAMWSILLAPDTKDVDFIFYMDRLSTLLIEQAMSSLPVVPHTVQTPPGYSYAGLKAKGETSAVVILRGGACLETGLRRVIPECRTGRMLIQSSFRTGEPELHYLSLSKDVHEHACVLLLDAQMSSGGAALMAVKVLLDHGVREESLVFVAMSAGALGLRRLLKVFPLVRVLLCEITDDGTPRWMEKRYFGC